MSEIKLKPCPFCGGKAEIRITKYGGSYVMCTQCFSRTIDGGHGIVKAMWNRRVGEKNERSMLALPSLSLVL